MTYLWLKSIHLIFVIAWMAGMLIYPRLKIYQLQSKPGEQMFETMKLAANRTRHIILTPSITIAWILGIVLLWMQDWSFFSDGWFHVKLTLALVISAFHGVYIGIGKKIDRGEQVSEQKLRIMNEIPFVAMIVIVIMVIVKPF